MSATGLARRVVRSTVGDYRDAARHFQRPARRLLAATLLQWLAHAVVGVLFNLYLVARGFDTAFVGRAVSASGLGMALAALPAGVLAERWGRRRSLVAGMLIEAVGLGLRMVTLAPSPILAASFAFGVGQAMCAISAAPYIAEHSSSRERTHLFSAFFATEMLAGVAGDSLGGWIPHLLAPVAMLGGLAGAERLTLFAGAALCACAALPLLLMRGYHERSLAHSDVAPTRGAHAPLVPIAVNALLIGSGAGLVIPFMNLYFARRFGCSTAQIGTFFGAAQVVTAFAGLLGPLLARRFGRLRTAVGSQFLSLPFLVTLGAERHLGIAVGAFLIRATLMQASTPLVNAFIMESLPPALRARSTSVNNILWNAGWASSAILSGVLIQHFGYTLPFLITAGLYACAATVFFLSFRHLPERPGELRLSEEQKGTRGEGPCTE
jgi:MFS family permease